MKTILNKIMQTLCYVPAPAKPKAVPSKPITLTAWAVNDDVRRALNVAKAFYEKNGDRIVSVDLQIFLDTFEEALLLSSTDGASPETCKLFGQLN